MTSYQKIKADNERLRLEIFALVNAPDSVEAISIKHKYKMIIQVEKAVWMGDSTANIFNGFLKQIADAT